MVDLEDIILSRDQRGLPVTTRVSCTNKGLPFRILLGHPCAVSASAFPTSNNRNDQIIETNLFLLTKQNLPPSLNSYWQPFQTSIFNVSPPQFNRDFLLSDKTKPHPNPKFILSRPISNYVVFLKNANRNYSIFHNLWHSVKPLVKNWAPWTDQLIG